MLNIGQGVLGNYGQINRSVQPAENAKHFFDSLFHCQSKTSLEVATTLPVFIKYERYPSLLTFFRRKHKICCLLVPCFVNQGINKTN